MGRRGKDSTPEEVFSGSPRGLELCRAVERLLEESVPPGEAPPAATLAGAAPAGIRATTSQVAFSGRRRDFAYVWWPGRYVRSEVPAVLSIALHERLDSPRFKSVVQTSPDLWMHHLELCAEEDLDLEAAGWLLRARDEAG